MPNQLDEFMKLHEAVIKRQRLLGDKNALSHYAIGTAQLLGSLDAHDVEPDERLRAYWQDITSTAFDEACIAHGEYMLPMTAADTRYTYSRKHEYSEDCDLCRNAWGPSPEDMEEAAIYVTGNWCAIWD